MKLLKHLSLLPVFTIFAAVAAGPAKLAADSASNSDSVVAIVSVDGFAGFYFEDEKAEMPNLEALSKEGVRASGLKVSTPSVTWPNHTTMITGVPPAVHGLVGNNDFDRKTNKARRIIGDATFDKQEIVHVPTLYDIAHGKGLKTAGVRWPGSRNAGTFNWTVPSTKASEAKPFTTYNLLEEATEAVGFDFEKKGRNDIWRTSI